MRLQTRERARENMRRFEAHTLITNQKSLASLISIASSIGAGHISVFISESKFSGLKSKLRKNGFHVEYVRFKSLPNSVYTTIVWDIAPFSSNERDLGVSDE